MYVYILSERVDDFTNLYTVGFYKPNGKWEPESDHTDKEKAAARVSYLNGTAAVNSVIGEALNSGDGVYRP